MAFLDDFMLVLLCCAIGLWYYLDQLLGYAASRAIAKTPKAFKWTIERVLVRPSFTWAFCSEIVILNWTWHDPEGFDDPGDPPPKNPYVLQIDRLTLRLDFSSIYGAVKEHKAIRIEHLQAEGVRFNTRRNKLNALNLWEALQLPDDDTNVSAVMQKARTHGGLHGGAAATAHEEAGEPVVKALPAVATGATRKAAEFWRPEWGDKEAYEAKLAKEKKEKEEINVFRKVQTWFETKNLSKAVETRKAKSLQEISTAHSAPIPPARTCASTPLLNCAAGPEVDAESPASPLKYVEYPIGDPRRRPRWGVPVRFNIEKMVLLDVKLWILDLMMMDAHALQDAAKPETEVRASTVTISQARFEAKDPRRKGAEDGVRGIYLGEFVWTLIAEVVQLALKQSPSQLMRNAVLAVGYDVKDMATHLEARALQGVAKVEHAIADEFYKLREVGAEVLHKHSFKGLFHHHSSSSSSTAPCCKLQVHLIAGRQLTRNGRNVNVRAKLELHAPVPVGRRNLEGAEIVHHLSDWQIWTKAPKWSQKFELGPVTSNYCTLRIVLRHCRTKEVVSVHQKGANDGEFLGEVTMPISAVSIHDHSVKGEIVGWFPLMDPREMADKNATITGQIKLGLQLINPNLLSDVAPGEDFLHADHSPHVDLGDSSDGEAPVFSV